VLKGRKSDKTLSGPRGGESPSSKREPSREKKLIRQEKNQKKRLAGDRKKKGKRGGDHKKEKEILGEGEGSKKPGGQMPEKERTLFPGEGRVRERLHTFQGGTVKRERTWPKPSTFLKEREKTSTI